MDQMRTSCVNCDMGKHERCVAVKLGEKWLTSPEKHCWCFKSGHKESEGKK